MFKRIASFIVLFFGFAVASKAATFFYSSTATIPNISFSTATGNLVTLSSTPVPASPGEGSLWNDPNQKTFAYQMDGIAHSAVGRIFVSTSNYTVSNSSSNDVSIVPAGLGTRTLPANYLQTGKVLRVRASGIYSSTTTTAGTVTFKIKLGATTISTTTTINSLTTSQTNQLWVLNATFICQTVGSSGTIINNGVAGFYDTTNGLVAFPMTTLTGATIDTTSSGLLDVLIQFSVASSLNSITTTNLTILDW